MSCPNKEKCYDKQRSGRLIKGVEISFIYRYNCFICDFDICIICGSKLEEENVTDLQEENLMDKMLRVNYLKFVHKL